MQQYLPELAAEFEGRLTVAALDIDRNPLTAPRQGIEGIPTQHLVEGGRITGQRVGAFSKSQILEFLQEQGI
ncbi:thioredoxin [Streptomyces anulatus]|uniref:thioredoxin domain-containing protein n=1 Tax=Streptomyces anulatus TaxID=1892 RepID=UPI001C60704B|nr:thioredoxin [Streptomyces anulatus]